MNGSSRFFILIRKEHGLKAARWRHVEDNPHCGGSWYQDRPIVSLKKKKILRNDTLYLTNRGMKLAIMPLSRLVFFCLISPFVWLCLFLWWGPEWLAAGLFCSSESTHALHGCALCYHGSAISMNHQSTTDLIVGAWTLATGVSMWIESDLLQEWGFRSLCGVGRKPAAQSNWLKQSFPRLFYPCSKQQLKPINYSWPRASTLLFE